MVRKADLEELRLLREAELKLLRKAAYDDLWTFATEVLWPDEAHDHYYEPLHRPICDLLSRAEPGTRQLILLPRQHRKTTLFVIAHAVWRIVRDPDIRIILVSALDDTAQQFCQLVKRQFQFNENFLRVFPEFRVGKRAQFGRQYDFDHPLRSERSATGLADPTFRSFYLGAPVAGRRCDILLLDDAIEKRHVSTPEQAAKAMRDVNDLLPVVDTAGKYNMIFVTGTRWAHNDIYANMLGETDVPSDDNGEQARLVFDAVVRHALEDAEGNADIDGEPILPSVFSRESLLRKLEEYRSDPKHGEEDWWKQYMNVCVSPSGRKFEPEWFDSWVENLPGGIVFSAILCDSASKDEQILMRGDFTVALVAHFDAYGHLYLTDGVRSDRMKGADLIRELLSMTQRCALLHGIQVTNFVKEKVGEDTFFGWVQSEFARHRIPMSTIPVRLRGKTRKYTRILEALQHPAMARQIHFVRDFPRDIWQAIVDEAVHLGMWSHDDAIDALSLAFHPDIRVIPSMLERAWEPPVSARLVQPGTAQHVPARLAAQQAVASGDLARLQEWHNHPRPEPDLSTLPEGRVEKIDIEDLP